MNLGATRAMAFGLALAGMTLPAVGSPAPTGEWQFQALLDGKPIGQHRFSVTGQGDERKVVSEANFEVKFMGFSAYTYRHKATETWQGGCLSSLSSDTLDDGKPQSVRADRSDATLQGCVMSFAYWNPAIQTQTKLLNAQTGKLETVQVKRAGSGSVEVHGKPVEATEFRITGTTVGTIAVWYSAQGEWVGLDSTVAGGRKLSYRLP